MAVFSRYVALGDSFTEGIGDPHPASPNGVRGWADHVAIALAQSNPDLRYANLAVRGRRMDEILTEQVQTAGFGEREEGGVCASARGDWKPQQRNPVLVGWGGVELKTVHA